jgi:hypothetical protein
MQRYGVIGLVLVVTGLASCRDEHSLSATIKRTEQAEQSRAKSLDSITTICENGNPQDTCMLKNVEKHSIVMELDGDGKPDSISLYGLDCPRRNADRQSHIFNDTIFRSAYLTLSHSQSRRNIYRGRSMINSESVKFLLNKEGQPALRHFESGGMSVHKALKGHVIIFRPYLEHQDINAHTTITFVKGKTVWSHSICNTNAILRVRNGAYVLNGSDCLSTKTQGRSSAVGGENTVDVYEYRVTRSGLDSTRIQDR